MKGEGEVVHSHIGFDCPFLLLFPFLLCLSIQLQYYAMNFSDYVFFVMMGCSPISQPPYMEVQDSL